MIIEQFHHEIDDGGLIETARLVFAHPGLDGRSGITADRLPATLVAAMRAYLMGNVTEPVEWMIAEAQWNFGLRIDVRDEVEIGLHRTPPIVVSPHDGNFWWRIYWPKFQQAQQAVEIFREIGAGQ